MSKNGVIFVAAGEPYAQAANLAAQTVRHYASSISIDLFTDVPEVALDVFDQVHRITNPHSRSKVDYLHQTRFERSLYLDTDIRLVTDITEMFKVLDRFDIAIAHAHARNRTETNTIWRLDLPQAFPQMNSGVILFRSTPQVLQILRLWQQSYHSARFRKDQVTLRELLWSSDLRIHILPPEYNIRYERYLSFWEEKEAVPRILHFTRFHDPAAQRAQPAPKPPNTRLARFLGLLSRNLPVGR